MADITFDNLPLVHEVLRERLRGMIGVDWKPGDKLPPIKELAQDLNAGHVNTHRAVKQLVSEGLLLSRPRRGTIVNPRLATAETPPPRLHKKTVGLISRLSEGEFFLLPAMEELSRFLHKLGATSHLESYLQHHTPNECNLAGHDYSACVLINPPTDALLTCRPDRPLLLITTRQDLNVAMASGYDIVTVDSEQGGFLAGQHLRERGLTRAAFIGCRRRYGSQAADNPDFLDMTSQLRLSGFHQGFQQPRDQVSMLAAAHYLPPDGVAAVSWFLSLDPRPEGVFCASDELAVGFSQGVRAQGLLPGKDVQIIGFDGQTRGQDLPEGALTTVAVPATRMGLVAGNHLKRRLLDPTIPARRVSLACSILQGVTTRQL